VQLRLAKTTENNDQKKMDTPLKLAACLPSYHFRVFSLVVLENDFKKKPKAQ